MTTNRHPEIELLNQAHAALTSELLTAFALARNVIDTNVEVMRDCLRARIQLDHDANVLCGIVFDIERANEANSLVSICAYCGESGLRKGEVMNAHISVCEKHPMAALRKELESQATLAAAYKRERDAARADLKEQERVWESASDESYRQGVVTGCAEGFASGVEQAAKLAEFEAGEDVGDWTNQNAAFGRHSSCIMLAAQIRALVLP